MTEQYLPFEPVAWLRNAHLQSLMASAPPRRGMVLRQSAALRNNSESLLVDCGDDVRLLAHYTPPGIEDNGRTVVLIHGWEGSSDSLYNLSVAPHLHAAGFGVVRLNLRDHGDSHHLNRELFHSCRLDEVVGAIRWLEQRFTGRRLALVGYSLGGNFALRVALQAPAAGISLEQVVAVCPVLDPATTMRALDDGLLMYRRYFIAKWWRSLQRKRRAFPDEYDFSGLAAFRTLAGMTDFFVTRYTPFPTLQDYLSGYSLVGDMLAPLKVPSAILLADDDPVIPVNSVTGLARPPALTVHRTLRGGHCGYLQSFPARSWMDEYVLRQLQGRPMAG